MIESSMQVIGISQCLRESEMLDVRGHACLEVKSKLIKNNNNKNARWGTWGRDIGNHEHVEVK